jgi:hypothetical protein
MHTYRWKAYGLQQRLFAWHTTDSFMQFIRFISLEQRARRYASHVYVYTHIFAYIYSDIICYLMDSSDHFFPRKDKSCACRLLTPKRVLVYHIFLLFLGTGIFVLSRMCNYLEELLVGWILLVYLYPLLELSTTARRWSKTGQLLFWGIMCEFDVIRTDAYQLNKVFMQRLPSIRPRLVEHHRKLVSHQADLAAWSLLIVSSILSPLGLASCS